MNGCERFEELISAYLDGELSAEAEAELRAHMAHCPDCAAMYEAFAAVGEAIRTQDVPDTLHTGIMETVRAAEKASRTQHTIIRLRPILAAAACLVVLVGTVFALKNNSGMGRSAMKSASADAPAAMEQNAMFMTAGTTEAVIATAPAAESAAEDGGISESKMEAPASAQADMAVGIMESVEAPKAAASSEAVRDFLNVNDSAKIVSYDDTDDVIAHSALIARVEKTGEEPAASPEYDRFTLSHVLVLEVLQSADDMQVEAGSEIDVLESQWSDDGGTVHHTEGYLKMETGKQYLLFLGYDPAYDRYYPLGLLYGKLPWDPEEPLFSDAGNEQVISILAELRNRFCPEAGE